MKKCNKLKDFSVEIKQKVLAPYVRGQNWFKWFSSYGFNHQNFVTF